jgi:hypothetical protein
MIGSDEAREVYVPFVSAMPDWHPSGPPKLIQTVDVDWRVVSFASRRSTQSWTIWTVWVE